MLERIRLNLQAVENLLFFWNMVHERQKVSEVYILRVAETPEFRAVYDDEFDNISVRKVLSALSNREVFRGDNRKESRFWVDNLWMLEDLDHIMKMVSPLKRLHLDDLVETVRAVNPDFHTDTIEVLFVPFYRQKAIVA